MDLGGDLQREAQVFEVEGGCEAGTGSGSRGGAKLVGRSENGELVSHVQLRGHAVHGADFTVIEVLLGGGCEGGGQFSGDHTEADKGAPAAQGEEIGKAGWDIAERLEECVLCKADDHVGGRQRKSIAER